jgi:dephospho-CoA kinase
MPERRPYLIGLTGNIACGKSFVASILEELGAELIDADRVAHEMMSPGSELVTAIGERFGRQVINPDGSLNRPALGQIVFSDPRALDDLERLAHPPTVEEIQRRAETSGASVVVIDAIKLFEAGLADFCDENWTVYCEPTIQHQRLVERSGFSEAEARQRIDAQPPQDEKRVRADRVIDNSGEREETRRQVERAWQSIPKAG